MHIARYWNCQGVIARARISGARAGCPSISGPNFLLCLDTFLHSVADPSSVRLRLLRPPKALPCPPCAPTQPCSASPLHTCVLTQLRLAYATLVTAECNILCSSPLQLMPAAGAPAASARSHTSQSFNLAGSKETSTHGMHMGTTHVERSLGAV